MKKRGTPRTLTGTVVSNQMDKTVVVSVERLVRHPVYKKYIRRKGRFMAHDNATGEVHREHASRALRDFDQLLRVF